MTRVLVDAVLGPAHPRGIGRYVREIARHGQDSGEASFALAIAPWHRAFFASAADQGIELVEVKVGARRGLRNVWHAYGIARLARSVGADVVHVPDRLPVYSAAGRPLVITVHDTAEVDLPDAFGPLQRRYRRWVLFDQLRRATQVIAPSHFSAGRIGSVAPAAAEKTTVVNHGPGLDPEQPERAPVSVPQQPFVLFVGAVQRHKSVPLLVSAFRAADLPGTSLVIAGGAHNDEAAVAAAAANDPAVIRLRDLDDAELAWLYRRAAAVVMPSRYEGFCIPLVEAMEFGSPVVAAAAGAMPEIAGDAALLVPPNDHPALSAALTRVMSDEPLRATLIEKGRARAATFSWQRAATETIAVYRSALAKRR